MDILLMAKDGFGLEITELTLGLPGGGQFNEQVLMQKSNVRKRVSDEVDGKGLDEEEAARGGQKVRKKKKNQEVVGWPPVCSHRMRNITGREDQSRNAYVKVSMDGAPFLRKIDLTAQKSYSDLQMHLQKLFGCYAIGEGLEDGDSSEYVPIYEDRDGDWMLLGDVPWTMFIESCKRLRIMKKTEAKGIGIHPKSTLNGTS